MKKEACCEPKHEASHEHHHKPKFYKHPLFWMSIITAALFTSSFYFPILGSFRQEFIKYWSMIWWAIILGFLLGGFISGFVPQTFISKILGQRKAITIPKAIALGFLFSACSHGILAISMAFYKKGASTSSVIAFLLAAPWANLAFVPIMFAFFGKLTVFIIGGSLLIALITGLIFQRLEARNMVEVSPHTIKIEKDFSIIKDLKEHYAAWKKKHNWGEDFKVYFTHVWALIKMVMYWILIGVIAASLMGAYIPIDFMQKWMGATVLGLLITIGIAVVIEICSEGSFPIAFEIFNKTGALGNAFAFLNAGVATDYTELGIIWKNIGRKAALWLLAIALPQILVLAYLMNLFI